MEVLDLYMMNTFQVERLRKELQLLQRMAAGAVRRAAASPGDDDIIMLVSENDDLRCRLRQVDGDCELAMCELEAALLQVEALDPAELQVHEAEIQSARAVLSLRNVRALPPATGGAVPGGETALAADGGAEAAMRAEASVEATALELWGKSEEAPFTALHAASPSTEELCSY
jgi:hypothetical protein